MVFQSYNLFGHMTVLENVMQPQVTLLHRSRQDACDIAMQQLSMVGMADRILRYPDELSGGQKQRVAIARTLAMDPELILFDEPTSALDPTMVGEVEYIIKKLAGEGRTMLIVTHEMRFAREVSNRVFYMDEKGIYEDGPTEQIFTAPQRKRPAASSDVSGRWRSISTQNTSTMSALCGRSKDSATSWAFPDRIAENCSFFLKRRVSRRSCRRWVKIPLCGQSMSMTRRAEVCG